MKLSEILTILVIFLIGTIGCSNSKNPVQPEPMDALMPYLAESPQNPIAQSFDNRNVTGAWKVIADIDKLSADIIPSRNAQAIGDTFDADLSQFLMVSPCQNCLRITGLKIDYYGNLLMDIGIKHPFSDIAKRPDLHGFDVRAIFIIPNYTTTDYPDIQVLSPDGTSEAAVFDDTSVHVMINSPGGLLGADGYTSHYDWLPRDERYFLDGNDIHGNINPFLRYFENHATDIFNPHSPSGYNVMPVGSDFEIRTAVFNKRSFTDYKLEFYIVVDVAYGHSAVYVNRSDPQYYLPSFNRTESWRVEYWIENNNLTPSDDTSSADLVVQVFDWQHGNIVDPSYPNPDNFSGIKESSNVLKLELSIPGYQDDPIVVTTPESGDGSPQNPLQYRMQITNKKTNFVGSMGLLAIRDELHGQPQPSGRLAVPASPSGFPYETRDIIDYSLYTPVAVNMKSSFVPPFFPYYYPNYELLIDYESLAVRTATQLAPSFFMDPSNRKFDYYWDFDYDGVNFNVDATGLPSPATAFSPGFHNVAFGVRTNSVPPREYLYELPVFSEGTAFNQNHNTIVTGKNITSQTREHSVAKGKNNKFYHVYTCENPDSNFRDVVLSIIDRDGSTTTHYVTNTTENAYHPSVCLIEDGVNDGVYVTWCERVLDDYLVLTKKGNLDGSGFLTTTSRFVSPMDEAYKSNPVITYFDDKLIVIYVHSPNVFINKIYLAHSSDYATTWTNTGWCVDNGSNVQAYPTIAQRSNRLFLVWSDGIELSTNGWDLFLADSVNGTGFANISNISSEPGQVNELYPSMNHSGEYLGIAYVVTHPSGSTFPDRVKAKILYPLLGDIPMMTDIVVTHDMGGDTSFGMPSIGFKSHGRFFVAYNTKNDSSDTLGIYFIDVYNASSGYWVKTQLWHRGFSGVNTNIKNIFPAVHASSPQPNVIENFIALTDYESGSSVSSSPPTEYLGDITGAYHVFSTNE